MSLSTIMKRLINDEYKTLVKAGYLDTELKITDAGRIMLNHILLEKHLSEFVKAAKNRIEEEN